MNIFEICIPVTGTWKHFGLNLRNKIFSKYQICARTQQIMEIFIIKQISWKLMTKFFFKFNKILYFWLISGLFPNFGNKKCFSKKSDYATHNFIRFLATIKPPNNQKHQEKTSKKTTEKTTARKNEQILFHRTLQATARGSKSKTATEWFLKIKDIE